MKKAGILMVFAALLAGAVVMVGCRTTDPGVAMVRQLSQPGGAEKIVRKYLDQGLAFYSKGDYDHAIIECNEALKFLPVVKDSELRSNVYLIRGNAYFGKGEYEKAADDYDKVPSGRIPAENKEQIQKVRQERLAAEEAAEEARLAQQKAEEEQLLKTENSSDDFDVVQNKQGKITITKYKGTRKIVVIPAKIHGIDVTEIGEGAFEQVITIFDSNAERVKKALTAVIIPNSVTSIGNLSFSGNLLTNVVIPNKVTSIGNGAFQMNKLTSVIIPNSVISIGDGVFYDNLLTSVTISNSLTSIGDVVFDKNQLTKIAIGSNMKLVFDIIRPTYTNVPTGNTFFGIELTEKVETGSEPHRYSVFEEGFINFYNSQGKKAGTYIKQGQIWTRE